MAKTKYNLHLKGYVGGWDFDSDYVDFVLNKNTDKEVSVLIDSLGGQLNTALSISSAFRQHGNVRVHFVGMNASAATIASMGVKRITMDHSAMYLVHQCSQSFFEWGSMNATDMQHLINNLEKQKADLDKLDANVAEMYAGRCKKKSADLLALMKVGGWLTAEEALAWGFVDELTDFDDESAPVLTDALAADFTAHGIPLPKMRTDTKPEDITAFRRFLQAFASVFHSQDKDHKTDHSKSSTETVKMKKTYTNTAKEVTSGAIAAEEGNYMKITDAITSANAVDVAKQILFSLDSRLRSQTLFMYCSQDFVDKYNEGYLLTHSGIPYNTQYNQPTVEGSNGKLIFCPLSNKADSKYIHISPKINMLYGYDQMGDVESVDVERFDAFLLSYIATMFFGVQFESIDKRRLKVVELAAK